MHLSKEIFWWINLSNNIILYLMLSCLKASSLRTRILKTKMCVICLVVQYGPETAGRMREPGILNLCWAPPVRKGCNNKIFWDAGMEEIHCLLWQLKSRKILLVRSEVWENMQLIFQSKRRCLECATQRTSVCTSSLGSSACILRTLQKALHRASLTCADHGSVTGPRVKARENASSAAHQRVLCLEINSFIYQHLTNSMKKMRISISFTISTEPLAKLVGKR